MNKLMCCLFCAYLCGSYGADVSATIPFPHEGMVIKGGNQKMMEQTGGVIEIPAQGTITVLNCQTKIRESEVREKAEKFSKLIHVRIEVRTGEWSLTSGLPADSKFAVYIVDDSKLPMSLVAVEARWGVVNVATLDSGMRYAKEFSRVATLTLGGGNSQYKGSPLQPVSCPADLDKLKTDSIGVDSLNGMLNNFKVIGVTQAKRSSYRRACREGWAPFPTNEYQKAVWDQVHQLPTNPLKVEFDPKKGE